MRRAIATLVIGSLLVLATSAPAAGAVPTAPSLQPFEVLFTTDVPQFTNVHCDQEGGPSSFSYSASGVATGPYAGTFTETGAVTIGAQSNPGPGGIPVFSGQTTSWLASFVIESPLGTVRGVKWLVNAPNGFSRCVSGPPIVAANNTDQRADGQLRYVAIITTAQGIFWDQGVTSASVSQCDCFVGSNIARASSFLEIYRSDYETAQRGLRGFPPESHGLAMVSH